MAKYNLLDDDDIFEEDKDDMTNMPSSEKPQMSEPEPEPEIDINIDDDFDLEPASLSDDEFKTDVMETELDEESKEVMESEPEELDENPHFDDYDNEPESAPVKKVSSYYEDDYDDSRQDGVNYGPFIKIFVIILLLVGGYFLVDIFILSDSAEEAAEQQEPVKTPEQLKQEQEAAAKAAFLSEISGKINSDIRFVSGVINNVQSSAKLSSVIYYGNTFLLQVFGSTRAEVARAQMLLKEAGNSFEIISSDTRPGSNGGILSSYSIDINNLSSSAGQGSANFSDIADFENWVKQASSSNGLKVVTLGNNYLREESSFKKYEIVTTITGSIDGCNSFLQKLSANGSQVKIHKLNLSASDQRSFKPGKYQLKLILELFV